MRHGARARDHGGGGQGESARERRDGERRQPARQEIERAALELIRRRGREILATARRYAAGLDDADDAYQRGLEILVTKAPTTSEKELVPWLKTAVKHEAFALRRQRERHTPVTEDGELGDAISQWAAANDAEIVEFVEDMDAQGWKQRAELLRCVRLIETGDVDGMVVAKLDRYFRDQLGGHQTMKRIKEAKGFLAIPGDGIDTRHETGKMLFGFLLTIAEGEIDRFRAIFSDARKRAVARGIHPSAVAPAGYARETDEKGKVVSPLRLNRDAGTVTELFRRAARGDSWAEIARWANGMGIKTGWDTTEWTSRAVKGLIRNRVYLGEAFHGEFVNPRAHQPLTDEVTWRRAQREGSRSSVARSERRPALLSGMLRCAGCRYGAQSYFARGQRCYRCHRRLLGPGHALCPEPAYAAVSSGIEDYVVEQFFAQLERLEVEPFEDSSELAQVEDEIRAAEADLGVYRDDTRIADTLGADRYVAGLEQRRAKLDQLLRRRAELEAPLDSADGLNPVELRELWPELTVDERRRLLRSHIECVFLRRGRTRHDPIAPFIWICWRGEAPDLPRRGQKGHVTFPPFRFPDAPADPRIAAS